MMNRSVRKRGDWKDCSATRRFGGWSIKRDGCRQSLLSGVDEYISVSGGVLGMMDLVSPLKEGGRCGGYGGWC